MGAQPILVVMPAAEPPEHELVALARTGDARAYGVLVERSYARFLRFALRMLGDRRDAEEVVQDTFVRAYRALDRYEDRDRFSAWAFRILLNQCRTAYGKQRTQARYFVASAAPPETPVDPAPESVWSRDVAQALADLPADIREALLLKYIEEMSYEEIADLTGIGVSALKMRLKRAREKLQIRLERHRHG